ncbi:TonB-dependent receptor [Mucilaginibacter aquatilis]|uniref:TonB-dependent receptor plug domain-containing protein n=1 Tax=Mucilaginibacter aquatilis TaxID=1517760 RepID=A0A6I4IGK5_9SPHI|nr:TonB-dependent receptor [Mucilaginibacter aquatilis]MVN92489.1 TonB-dependent receptor plug domain-containing protein [Mucilaginibacter aquatilis]
MYKKLTTLSFVLFSASNIYAQMQDSSRTIEPVTVRGYLSEQRIFNVPSSVGVLSNKQLNLQPNNSLVSAMNTLPGIRMEERTPGSYRLSIRGSLLRSPFGVRNVKIYFDEIPLTDAGGNSYLNALDVASLHSIEVLKGPDGSLFGANSGGVVIINPVNRLNDSSKVDLNFNAGSYGLIHQNAGVSQKWGKNQLDIKQAYQTYDGYRDHSYLQRHYFQLVDRYSYGQANQLKALGFYSDLQYQTPGGLNQAQFDSNPRASRPATATLPGAIDQNIGISTKVLFGGLVNEVRLTDRIRNVASVFGTRVKFNNPFITNYEQRNENTYGGRTYFELVGLPSNSMDWKVNLGAEWQQTNATINNYDNQRGEIGKPQAFDNVNTNQHFVFARYAAKILQVLNIEAALSLNFYSYKYQNIFPLNEQERNTKNFDPQLMPRIALSYQILDNFIWRASVSRGYSTPTIAEVRPSNNVVNINLQPETGWNYETGLRVRNSDESLMLDASVFYYRLRNTIVNQRLANETDYFVNAGGTKQLGVELSFTSWIMQLKANGFLRGIQFNEAFTYNNFNFRNYNVNNNNYSGNSLTGVPKNVAVSSLQFRFPKTVYVFIQHNYTGRLPVNDANTVYASKYNLLQAKAGLQLNRAASKVKINIYAGTDNLLNQKYSLGNDLNAVGNRFFNPAPLRNYYAGLNLSI